MCIRDSIYTNIPVNQTLDILYNNLIKSNKLDAQSMNELICILRVILQQNYFTFNGRYYIQRNGLAMGSPSVSYTHLDVYKRQWYNNLSPNSNSDAKSSNGTDSRPRSTDDEPHNE